MPFTIAVLTGEAPDPLSTLVEDQVCGAIATIYENDAAPAVNPERLMGQDGQHAAV